MRAPFSWIAEYVDLPDGFTGRELSDALIRVGLEVERVESAADGITGPIVVGRVLEFSEELQKNGKTVRWCQVDVGSHGPDGSSEPRGVICGAGNFAVGDLIVAALPGAVLPGGFAIASRKTYGHLSDGMICSARELGLGDDHTGIMIIEAGLPGEDALVLLGMNEPVLDIAVTPDRGYCLSMRGLAREAALALGVRFHDIDQRHGVERRHGADASTDGDLYPCRIDDPSGSAMFSLRTVSGVNIDAPSPSFMVQRLQLAGIRPISLAVDVTNYVMLETGQPLHAYDRAAVQGEIVVRRAAPNEALVTLDDVKRELDPDDVVIADDSGVIGLAGVMGGAATRVSDNTVDLVLEAATFDAPSISRAVRRHKLPSEAAKRFERGVDPQIAEVALARCVQLLIEHGGATASGIVNTAGNLPTGVEIALGADLPGAVAGMQIDTDVVVDHLQRVGCQVVHTPAAVDLEHPHRIAAGTLAVLAPTWRPDLTDPADLVEEVIRIVGYDQVPSALPTPPPGRGLTQQQRQRRAVSRAMAAAGYVEVLNYPFVSADVGDVFGLTDGDERRRAARLVNPLSDAEPLLRTTLLPGLLGAVSRNLGRGTRELALYETGLVFLPAQNAKAAPLPGVGGPPSQAVLAEIAEALPRQPWRVAAVLCGANERAGWWGEGRQATWSDAIDAARTVAQAARANITVSKAELAPWHPGRCAQITLESPGAAGEKVVLGYAGELHPRVLAALGLPERTCAMELELDALPVAQPAVAPDLSVFPPVLLDVALVVDIAVDAATLMRTVRESAGELLETARVFDVFTDAERLGSGKKSIAFALRFRAPDRTLTAAEAVAARDQIVELTGQRHGAMLRD